MDGKAVEGWFAEDFTLAEIKTLRGEAAPRRRASAWDGVYEVPTLQEVIDLVKREECRERPTGLHLSRDQASNLFRSARISISTTALLEALDTNGYTDASAPVFVQSFEVGNLKGLRRQDQVRLIQLLDDYSARPYDLVRAGDPRTYRDLMAPPR